MQFTEQNVCEATSSSGICCSFLAENEYKYALIHNRTILSFEKKFLMAKNDKILVDGIIDERIENKFPSVERDEVFEYFAFEQALKDYDLSSEEILSGNVDGRNDGGIDGFFIIVNGHLLSDIQSFAWPKAGCVLEVIIITCKHHDTFKQPPMDNLVASLSEILDFSIVPEEFKGDYSEKIIRYRENLKYAYKKVASRISEFNFKYYYASRGNTDDMGESIVSRSNQINQITNESFGNCNSSFEFLGATELVELHRKVPNFSLELPFIEDLSSGERYVVLVNLIDYYNFISEEGKLRRYLFDSNVRDFMGLNRVNEDIKQTLIDVESPDFWLLNNGVTILATDASVIGKSIQIEGIQIVNGLQTSESIYRHFVAGGEDPNRRSVMVKVIVSKDDVVRDTIIRATNNQTNVELASLHATDKIQRDIEDILKQHDLFYERRTNYYRNQDIPRDQIFTPLYLAAGYVNLILKSANRASNLKSRFMRSEDSYNRVFSHNVDLKVWPQIAKILLQTDRFIESVRPANKRGNDRMVKSQRQFLSFLTISRFYGSYNFTISDLVTYNLSSYNREELLKTWTMMMEVNGGNPYNNMKNRYSRRYFVELCRRATEIWNIDGLERIVNHPDSSLVELGRKKNTKIAKNMGVITMEFAMLVHELLPEQPWKPGTHKKIANQMECTQSDIYKAVEILIEEGLRYYQKDGVVFDLDGNIIGFDEKRVDTETLRLKPKK